MTRRYGRAPRGERVRDGVPRNYGSYTSVTGAMGLRGLVATLAVEGAVDTLCFDAYAENVLGPQLRRGDVVVPDNLTAHRASRIEEVAESRGAQVLWPAPYSPDFPPIQQCWSKIKAFLRQNPHHSLLRHLAREVYSLSRFAMRVSRPDSFTHS